MIERGKHGPWAVIAGASEGIGEQFARQLAEIGIGVVLVSRRQEVLDELADSIRKERGGSVGVRAVALDLTDRDAAARLAAQTSDLEVGLLVYNAGADTGPVAFHDRTLDEVMHFVNLNVVTPTQLCHHYGKLMRDRRRGGIILVGSMAGLSGSALIATYAATKAYDHALAEGLWRELAEHNVDVMTLVAGATATPAHERTGATFGEDFPRMDPADVARTGIEWLGRGPLRAASDELQQAFDAMRALPIEQVIEFMSMGTRAIYGLDHAT
jgi:short-subunit dehydrogenase